MDEPKPRKLYKHVVQIVDELNAYEAKGSADLEGLHGIGPWCGWCERHVTIWLLLKLHRDIGKLKAEVKALRQPTE